MNEKLKNLLEKINEKKQEVRDFVEEDKLDEAEKAKEELKALQRKFDLLAEVEDAEATATAQAIKNGAGTAVTKTSTVDKAKNMARAFVNAIKAGFKGGSVSEEDREYVNEMKEGSGPDGGLTVPQDIRTEIKELRRSEDALETLVNVERVTTLTGSRVIEEDAENTPFDNVDEGAEFPEDSTPQLRNIEYKCKKKGGILRVTSELLEDSAENILAYLKKWITKKSKATRNFLIINKIKEITEGKEVEVTSLDTFKDIFNETLDPAIALGAKVVTNQTGFNYLDKMKDNDGNYLLQKDPTQSTKRLLFGEYPVIKLSNRTLKNITTDTGYNVPIICGNLKEAITIFDRDKMSIDISNVAGDLWSKDKTGLKVRERLDIQAVDKEAVVMAVVPVASGAAAAVASIEDEGTTSDLEAELNAMTKDQILAKATEEGLELDVTTSNTKAEIVAAYIAAVEAN